MVEEKKSMGEVIVSKSGQGTKLNEQQDNKEVSKNGTDRSEN